MCSTLHTHFINFFVFMNWAVECKTFMKNKEWQIFFLVRCHKQRKIQLHKHIPTEKPNMATYIISHVERNLVKMFFATLTYQTF